MFFFYSNVILYVVVHQLLLKIELQPKYSDQLWAPLLSVNRCFILLLTCFRKKTYGAAVMETATQNVAVKGEAALRPE